MAQAQKPTGGRKPGQFGTTSLRLGRATGIGEFFDVLEDATAKRMERMLKGYGHAIVSSALSPLPTFAQASIYDAITDPFGGRKDQELSPSMGETSTAVPTAERVENLDKLYNVPLPVVSREGLMDEDPFSGETSTAQRVATAIGVEGAVLPLWQSNLEKLFKVPLLVTEKKDTLKLVETEREEEPEKVDDDEEDKFSMKEFFGSIFGGMVDIGAFLLKSLGTIAIGALKFTGGVGIMGLLASLIFNKEIVDQFMLNWEKEALKLGSNTEWGARIASFFGSDADNGASFLKAATAAAGGGAVLGITGLLVAGPWGGLIGLIVGGALAGVAAALGKMKLVQITNFISDWWNKSWEEAHANWQITQQKHISAEISKLEKEILNAPKDSIERDMLQSKLDKLKTLSLESEHKEIEAKIETIQDEIEGYDASIEKKKKMRAYLKDIMMRVREVTREDDETASGRPSLIPEEDRTTQEERLEKFQRYLLGKHVAGNVSVVERDVLKILSDVGLLNYQSGDTAWGLFQTKQPGYEPTKNLMEGKGILRILEKMNTELQEDAILKTKKDLQTREEKLLDRLEKHQDRIEQWERDTGRSVENVSYLDNMDLLKTGQELSIGLGIENATQLEQGLSKYGAFASAGGIGSGSNSLETIVNNNDASQHTNSSNILQMIQLTDFATDNYGPPQPMKMPA